MMLHPPQFLSAAITGSQLTHMELFSENRDIAQVHVMQHYRSQWLESYRFSVE